MNSSASDLFPLNPWEDLFYSLYRALDGAGIGGVVMRIEGRVEADTVRIALACLQARHPKLRSRIIEADGRRWFQVLPSPPQIPLEIKDFDNDDFPWALESSRILSMRIDPSVDSLARVLVLRSRKRANVILVAHHAISDGRSIMRLVDDLLTYYEAAEVNPLEARAKVSSLPMVMVRSADLSSPLPRRLAMMIRMARHRRANRKERWTSLPRTTGVPPYRLWSHHVFPEADTLSLARLCRREKTTLYGALFGASACALAKVLSLREARFKCRFPIDIRTKLRGGSGPVTKDDLGNFFSGYENIYEISEPYELWDLARRAHRDVKTFVDAGGPSLVYNLIRWAKYPYVPKTFKRGTLFVSNYGVVAVRERYGSLTLDELSTVFNNDRVGPSFMVQAFIVGRRMNLSLGAVDVSEELWGSLRDEFLDQLQLACGNGLASAGSSTPQPLGAFLQGEAQ